MEMEPIGVGRPVEVARPNETPVTDVGCSGSPSDDPQDVGKPRPVAADLKFNDSVKRHTSDYREGIYELVDRLASEEAKSGGRVVNARPSRNPEARGGG